MKCQKCGVNEVSFHHSTNVNGCVTETHLCSRCAAESGYDIEKMFDFGNIFDGMFQIGGLGGFMPVAIPMAQAKPIFPFSKRPAVGMIGQDMSCQCGCAGTKAKEINAEVDEEMKMRRELNAQMRAAVASEEFEKAAELRDKIRALEIGGANKCDSETTTQDSPTAQ